MFSNKNSERLLSKIRDGHTMTRGEKLSLIVELSIPSILAQITSVLMFYIDASMVGSLGTEASAAIGLVEPATWLFGSLTSAASLGYSVQVAHFIGANDFRQARRVMKHGYLFCAGVALLLMIVASLIAGPLPAWLGGGEDIHHQASMYFLIFSLAAPFFMLENLSSAMLKSSGDMRRPSSLAILTCVLDVVFNFIFIFPTRTLHVLGLDIPVFGFNLGVEGAALGTSLAYVVASLLLAYFAVRRSPILAWRLDHDRFVWEPDYIWRALRISGPMALQYMLMNGAQIVSTMIVAPLGNVSIAANSFAVTAESLCYMPGYGIGDAASTLVGQTYGAGRRDLCRSFAWMTIGMGMAVMAFMGAVMYIFAPEMINVLTPVPAIRELGAQVLRIEAFAEPFFAASIVSYSVCVGAGDTVKPAAMSLFSMWCVRLTLAYALSQHYGLRGVWIAMATELTFRGCIFLIRIARGRWMKGLKTKTVASA
ncbi:MAG: MATE family efflux transporter [Prevotella sp.]|jgi:putative MATE family efflux protein|nr:MATE family efflux transporter [Prevotella sp.]